MPAAQQSVHLILRQAQDKLLGILRQSQAFSYASAFFWLDGFAIRPKGVTLMSPARMSKVESALRIVLDFNDAFNRHDVAAMMQFMSDDCIFENTHPAPDGTVYAGKEAVTRFWQDFFRESPSAHIKIKEIFGLGDHCIMRWKYSWVDEAGVKGHVRGVDIFQIREGLIREKLSYVKG